MASSSTLVSPSFPSPIYCEDGICDGTESSRHGPTLSPSPTCCIDGICEVESASSSKDTSHKSVAANFASNLVAKWTIDSSTQSSGGSEFGDQCNLSPSLDCEHAFILESSADATPAEFEVVSPSPNRIEHGGNSRNKLHAFVSTPRILKKTHGSKKSGMHYKPVKNRKASIRDSKTSATTDRLGWLQHSSSMSSILARVRNRECSDRNQYPQNATNVHLGNVPSPTNMLISGNFPTCPRSKSVLTELILGLTNPPSNRL